VQRCDLSRNIARHVIGIGMYSCRQRANLRIMVNAQQSARDVVELLRESYEHRLGRGCSELLIMQARALRRAGGASCRGGGAGASIVTGGALAL
jgi:hypothetical protein